MLRELYLLNIHSVLHAQLMSDLILKNINKVISNFGAVLYQNSLSGSLIKSFHGNVRNIHQLQNIHERNQLFSGGKLLSPEMVINDFPEFLNPLSPTR